MDKKNLRAYFRLFHKGEYLYPTAIEQLHEDGGSVRALFISSESESDSGMRFINLEVKGEVEQHTPFVDKHGQDIWEGDLLLLRTIELPSYFKAVVATVTWENGSFCVVWGTANDGGLYSLLSSISAEDIEIVGNKNMGIFKRDKEK